MELFEMHEAWSINVGNENSMLLQIFRENVFVDYESFEIRIF